MNSQTIFIKEDVLQITPLGAGCEVGRSCIVMNFMGKTIMFDCGIHPSDNDLSSLPFFDIIDPAKVDLLLVTHFHLDHCGSVPYFLEKTSFKGKTYMTYPTKAIYKQVILDSLKVGVNQEQKGLFSRDDILNSMEKIEAINFHEQIEFDGIKFVAYNAGHVIGAAMFIVEINGVRILYTGDYSREKDIHIMPAEIPEYQIDVLIVESTYGIKNHEPREFRENNFLQTVEKIVKRKGKCLLPVFVLGRAQELLLLLEEYWNKKPELQEIKIYYASTMMHKCMLIFQTYINMMGVEIKEKMKKGKNPFNFKFISILKNMNHVEDAEKPMVVMASPGMLQKGLSRTLFQKWCHDKNNGVLFTGYCVENTLAKDILNGMREFQKENGQSVPIKMSVEYISFSAHADSQQTQDFIEKVKPKLVILVHGEKHEAMRLKEKLEGYFGEQIKFEAPNNWETVEMKIERKDKLKILGSLVEDIYKTEEYKQQLEGVYIKKKFNNYLCKTGEEDLILDQKIVPLDQKVHLYFPHSLDLVFYLAEEVLSDIKIIKCEGKEMLRIREDMVIYKEGEKELIMEWSSSKINDIIGDCIGYMLYNIADYKDIDIFSKNSNKEDVNVKEQKAQDIDLIKRTLQQNCGENLVSMEDNLIKIYDSQKNEILVLCCEKMAIEKAENQTLKKKVQNLINLIA